MKLKFKYLIICILFIPITIHSQENYKDSSYLSLYNNVIRTINNNDSVKAHFYIKEYKQKAIQESNNLQLATAYNYQISLDEKGHKTLHLYDSIIDLTKDLNVGNTAIAYYNKGGYYYKNTFYEKALDNYLKAIAHSKGPNKKSLTYQFNQSVALLKLRIGENKEALELLNKNWKHNIEKNDEKIHPDIYYGSIFNLAEAYRRNNYLDSARIYISKAIVDSSTKSKNKFYESFITLDGIIDSQKGNFSKSIETLNRVNLNSISENNFKYLPLRNFYLAKSYQGESNIAKAIENFKKVDSLYDITEDLLPETIETYSHLIQWEKENNNLEGELYYMKKLVAIDSSSIIRYKYLNERINKEFDIPLVLKKKEQLISELRQNKKTSFYFKISILIISIILILFLFYYKRKNALLEKRFNEFYEKKSKEITINQAEKTSKKTELPPDVSILINEKIKQFEETKGFLDQNITISSLAKEMGTNHSYLSIYINNTKECNFSVYLKALRINYAIEQLKIDPVYRKYTIKAIAKESGFKGSESFSKEFKKVSGMYPSYFIKKLNSVV